MPIFIEPYEHPITNPWDKFDKHWYNKPSEYLKGVNGSLGKLLRIKP